MSNVYLDNNRIMKMRDVDRELNKIGTWREYTKDIVLCSVFGVLVVAAGIGLGVCLKNNKPASQNNVVKTAVFDATQTKAR